MSISSGETPDPPRSRREERRERELSLRRADVIAAAAAEFAEKGFDGASMSALAARAEVALGTLYSLFESKEQLFQVVIDASAEAIRSHIEAEVEAVADPRERLLRLIDAGFERFQNDPVFFRIYAQSTHGWPARIRAAMGESAQAQFAHFVGWVVGLARDAAAAGALRGVDPEAFGLALMGALVNVTSALTAGATARPVAALAADVRTLFERLLGPEPAR
jgi:AcrR family transcriptional regulator